MKTTPRGIRNNNPLNIRYVPANKWQGRVEVKKDKEFEEFKTMYHGYRAAIKLIYNYMQKGLYTIPTIISKWAPLSENQTASYIRIVSQKTGIPLVQSIDFAKPCDMFKLISAMAYVECGSTPEPKEIVAAYLDVCTEKDVQLPIANCPMLFVYVS